ncbi:MAG: hypothetical protein IK076_05600 [Bacteroidales bacterium]|nr:hypothetical protein [Bacteroidales bacterium]
MGSDRETDGARCLECGGLLHEGRNDRKFCSSSCRNRWHYMKEGRMQWYRRKTIGILDRNHEILSGLIKEGVTGISIPDLVHLGYRTECITYCHKVGKHLEYRCYDIKYCMSESRIFKLGRCSLP